MCYDGHVHGGPAGGTGSQHDEEGGCQKKALVGRARRASAGAQPNQTLDKKKKKKKQRKAKKGKAKKGTCKDETKRTALTCLVRCGAVRCDASAVRNARVSRSGRAEGVAVGGQR